ncbi:MAG: hypothetical protein E7167_00285 [Firmicutes bacterium]|nr:hypothetical protein [Bacillota bacterium]
MKIFIKNSYLFLIFFILFFSKDFLYAILSPKEKIDVSSIYIEKLEKEITNINLIKGAFEKISGTYGKVLYQNPYKYNNELIVLATTKDIEKNDYVISAQGLIGVVDKIYQNHIIVKMLTNNEMLLQVRVNDCYGLLSFNKILLLSNVNNYCSIDPEDEIYTSNLGYQDEEILIGKIGTLFIDENKIANSYEIIPSANFNKLNYVVILTGDNL